MVKPVMQWMHSLGLTVKSEFITPWGICDLVGLSFKKGSVAQRRRLGQHEAISSISRAAIMLRIPDAETNHSITLARLVREFAPVILPETIIEETRRLEAAGFVRRVRGGQLQKLNGWAPLWKRFMAVELKLTRIEEAMSQAQNNLAFAAESYIALPEEVAIRVGEKRERWDGYFASGVGLLAVTHKSCRIVIQSRPCDLFNADQSVQFYCVEKFWRSYSKDLKTVNH